MTWYDDGGDEIDREPERDLEAELGPEALDTADPTVDPLDAAFSASDPDALRCDRCGVMPGERHQDWCPIPTRESLRAVSAEELVDLIERQNATDERLGVVDDKLDRLIELVQTALAPALGVPIDAPVMRVLTPEVIERIGSDEPIVYAPVRGQGVPVLDEPTEPEPEFEDGIDPAFLMGTMPVHEAGERQPSNRSTYRGPL